VADLTDLVGGGYPYRSVSAIGPPGMAFAVDYDKGDPNDSNSGNDDRQTTLMVTRDGETWQAWKVGDLVDRTVKNVESVDFVGGRIVVRLTVGDEDSFDFGSLESVTLVGTLR
jgi:hypothetical protein